MDHFVGEIRLFTGRQVPSGWHLCDGSELIISENEVLYSLIGTTYGGDGKTKFGLPDLNARIPVGMGGTYVLGILGGSREAAVNVSHMPIHGHSFSASPSPAKETEPTGAPFLGAASVTGDTLYIKPSITATSQSLSDQAVTKVGTGKNHPNVMPTSTVAYIIALTGSYPVKPAD